VAGEGVTSPYDPKAIQRELKFLKDNPHFDQRPASILEFLGPEYLNIEKKVRPGLKTALSDIFGADANGKRIADYERAMVTGGIGIGKTTFASIALPYMAHWVLCLRDPQDFFELLPGSRIAFMQMSTSEKQAKEVVFGDIFARIRHAKWFVENYPHDDKFTQQIRFPKDIWILPGDSAETTFEGYNILAGILDEMDSHQQTKDKDYADVGYDTIHSRIASRFIDEDNGGHKGLLIAIGQMKKGDGFAARKYKEFQEDDKAYTVRMTIWESLGWQRFLKPDGTRDSFFYDIKRKQIIPRDVAGVVVNPDFIEVPNAYRKDFNNNPEKALRDLAGIPPATNDPFISLEHRVTEAVEKWTARFDRESPVDDNPTRPKFAEWFQANGDPRRRAVHLDLAVSGNGDALGLAMGHIEELVEIDGELRPYIVFDCLLRIKAMPGTEILLSDVRRLIYELKDDRGFRIINVSMDGFQSTDTMQMLRKKKYRVDYLSVDKSTMPYEDLREAIYDGRIEFPPYVTYINKGDNNAVQIAVQELLQLQHDGKKIDHPVKGSKDVADAMAGVTSTLLGDRSYRKGVVRPRRGDITEQPDVLEPTGTDNVMVVDFGSDRAPQIDTQGLTGAFALNVPPHLRPRERRR
jgi:hypothetical protein